MGWKGVLREVGRVVKQAEKERKRNEKKRQKQRERRQASTEVHRFEARLRTITRVHTDSSNPIDWESVRGRPTPEKPRPSSRREDQARRALDSFNPSIFDRLLNRTEKKRSLLRQELADAKEEDRREFEEAREEFERKLAAWRTRCELAKNVLRGEQVAYHEVISQTEPLKSVDLIEGFESFEPVTEKVVSATIAVQDEHVVPSERKRQLKSGKLSVTDMPKTKLFGYYQDYVCSCVLRTALELHALLPIEMAVVTAKREILNTATGHTEQQPIVSAAIPDEILRWFNLSKIIPSDSMSRFVHEMEFRKAEGFRPVTPVDPQQFLG